MLLITISLAALTLLLSDPVVKAAGVITIPGDRFFPEGVAVSKRGTFYIGSMEEGAIVRALPGSTAAEPFIPAGANGLVSVLGLYADDASNTLWACSSDADNGKLRGTNVPALKAFHLETGAPLGSWALPGGGFCNDLTVDAQGSVYLTDSWAPRILKFVPGSSALTEWVNSPAMGAEQWSLNGIDIDAASKVLYVVNQRAGRLFSIPIKADGSAGPIAEITPSLPLRRPDGLKVIKPGLLATAEGGSGGISLIAVEGPNGRVTRVSEGLNGVATFAHWQGSAWIVEGQGQHFWDPENSGPNAAPPFRLVEIPLGLSSLPLPDTGVEQPPASLPNTSATLDGTSLLLGLALLLMSLGGALLGRWRRRSH